VRNDKVFGIDRFVGRASGNYDLATGEPRRCSRDRASSRTFERALHFIDESSFCCGNPLAAKAEKSGPESDRNLP
jgi:hypothetical protein